MTDVQTTTPADSAASIRTLQKHGAHFVLVRDKRPIWRGWQRRRPSTDVLLAHRGNIGLMPASIGTSALDVDQGDPRELLAHHPCWATLPSRRRDGRHLYYRDDRARGNDKWEAYGCRGEVRSGRGFLVLWDNGAERLAAAVRRGPAGVLFPGDLPLFEAAGIVLPKQLPPDATRRQLQVQPARRLVELAAVAIGDRNQAVFDVTRWWAYPQWCEWVDSHALADVAGWHALVLERAQRFNQQLRVPIGKHPGDDPRELEKTAYSISTWIASGGGPADHDPVRWRKRQAARGRKGGLVRRGILYGQDNQLRGDVYYRDRGIIAARAAGFSQRAIAERYGVSRGCVEHVLRRHAREQSGEGVACEPYHPLRRA